jgi:hypothetical protein
MPGEKNPAQRAVPSLPAKKKKTPLYTPEDLDTAVARVMAGEKMRAVLVATGVSYGTLQRYFSSCVRVFSFLLVLQRGCVTLCLTCHLF